MPEELYDRVESESAFGALNHIVTRLPEPFLLLGGWAVYVTVNDSFRDEHGSQYLGSRDIDVCFHIDPNVSESELRNSTFSKAIAIVQELGYLPHGSCRYCKIIRRDTRETITESDARDILNLQGFVLFISHSLFYDSSRIIILMPTFMSCPPLPFRRHQSCTLENLTTDLHKNTHQTGCVISKKMCRKKSTFSNRNKRFIPSPVR